MSGEGVEKMMAFARRQPLPRLAESLLLLDAKPKPDDAERLTRAVIMDVICEKCPEADAAFDAWAESDDSDPAAAVEVILARYPLGLGMTYLISWWAYVLRYEAREAWRGLPGPWWCKALLLAACLAVPGPFDEVALLAITAALRKRRSSRR